MTSSAPSLSERRGERLPSVDGLRGLAALIVLVSHAIFDGPPAIGHVPAWFHNGGNLAVDLFFILSGMTLTYVYDGRAFNYGDFIASRARRTYPMAILGALLVAPFVDPQKLAELYATTVTMTEAFTGNSPINVPSWSISVEWVLYLAFPIFRQVPFRGMAGLALLAVIATIDHVLSFRNQGSLAVLRALPEFLEGVVLARMANREHPFWSSDIGFYCVLALTGAFFAVGDWLVVLGFPALVWSAVCNRGLPARILNSRPLCWLGDISYSVYILQWAVVLACWQLHTGPVVTVVASVLFGAAGHYLVDVPCRRYLTRLPILGSQPRDPVRARQRRVSLHPEAVRGRA